MSLHLSAQHLLCGLSCQLIMGIFIKIYQEDPNLIKIRQKYQVLDIRARYVLLLPMTFIFHKIAAQQYQMYCFIAFAQQ
jgi:hypothetical protein